jgi:hypothetical protein
MKHNIENMGKMKIGDSVNFMHHQCKVTLTRVLNGWIWSEFLSGNTHPVFIHEKTMIDLIPELKKEKPKKEK